MRFLPQTRSVSSALWKVKSLIFICGDLRSPRMPMAPVVDDSSHRGRSGMFRVIGVTDVTDACQNLQTVQPSPENLGSESVSKCLEIRVAKSSDCGQDVHEPESWIKCQTSFILNPRQLLSYTILRVKGLAHGARRWHHGGSGA